jgi:sec-independent protein translocase protein TatC
MEMPTAVIVEKHESLIDHLKELRSCLIKSVWAIAIFACIAYYFSEQIFEFLRLPATKFLPNGGLVFTHPMDKFMAHLKIAIFSGVIGSAPFWLYQVWSFIAPGLYQKEKKYAANFIISGTVLFLTGVSFCYFLVLPAAFEFLFNFGGSVDKPMITISEYLEFVVQMSLMFGVSFELPLILVTLGIMGIVSSQFLKKQRRPSWLVLAIVSAILTPTPDALSMFMMLIPMVFLFEIAIFLVARFEVKNEKTA